MLTADLEADQRQAAQRAAVGSEQAESPTAASTVEPAAPGNPASSPNDKTVEDQIGPEPIRRYAERPEIEVAIGRRTVGDVGGGQRYEVANVEAAGLKPDRKAFYDIGYRPTLRLMAAHVISVEGPIFEDLLVQRIARAHGFGRAAGKIREIILDVVERRFPRSNEEGRKIFWPEGADKSQLPSFRPGSLENRDHIDIPLVELASLARRFLSEGAEPQEAAVLIGRDLSLGRLREAARARFEEAARLARCQTLSDRLS
jgi:Protein of unknown function (DUF3320)